MQCHDSNKKSKTSMYWDTNNLYGWGMHQPLPHFEFEWLSEREINELCLDSIRENNPIGYILEDDLEYPDELYDMRSDYPLATERLEIS